MSTNTSLWHLDVLFYEGNAWVPCACLFFWALYLLTTHVPSSITYWWPLSSIMLAYPGCIGLRRMILLWCNQEKHPVPHLDSVQWCDTHVEKDAKQCCHRNLLQEWLHVNRNAFKSQKIIRISGEHRCVVFLSALTVQWQLLPTKMATRMPLTLCSWTFSISAFGPLDMTVRALAWVTDRTVAALSQGMPKMEAMPPMTTRRSRSKWKPDPFIIFLSGLLTIKLMNYTDNLDKHRCLMLVWEQTSE